MTGKLFVIGVGPGDPELLTLKGARILREVPCLCVPKGREEGSSLALSIVQKAVDLTGKEIIEAHFPMKKTAGSAQEAAPSDARVLDTKWNETVETVSAVLARGTDMAFITIGDPTIYSTFFYLYDRLLELNPELPIEFVPGISSINAAAARVPLSLSLADEKIAIVPATYSPDLEKLLGSFDTLVLMKVYKVFDTVRKTLEKAGLAEKAVYVARAGMEDERVVADIRKVTESDLNYFSVIIVRK
ncbi:MAG: precorrin-2 C(20)-methyltransferase [Alphaproteobacteria bacterium]|uniref:Precorrin-2 C(20)-methyltransferase n=1 Tax=Candidatus Nitrobium versatile TaxID=2884831 RepID=A0A953M3J4_9BACT|nr:precorrin-2 C(20)-methyltransferase [Candidatus Nitrobium versatile]